MLPDMVLSTAPMPAEFIGGRALSIYRSMDYELGPVAIQDASKGLMYQIWRARAQSDFIYLSAPNTPEYALLEVPDLTEISFSFDQNANVVFAYVQGGIAKLYWFDAAISDYTTTVFGADVITPRVTLDDKRLTQRTISDVLVFYQRESALYVRVQRERYAIEHNLATELTGGIARCGMMKNLRIGVQLMQDTMPKWTGSDDDLTISLCHFDSESGGRIADVYVASGWYIVGDAQVEQSGKFGGGLLCRNESGGARAVSPDLYLKIDEPRQYEFYVNPLHLRTGTATVVFTLYGGALGVSQMRIAAGSNGSMRALLLEEGSAGVYWDINESTRAGVLTADEPNHVAITVSTGALKTLILYVNGQEELRVTNWQADLELPADSQIFLSVGAAGGDSRIIFDEFRCRRVIDYTSNFTPPGAPFL